MFGFADVKKGLRQRGNTIFFKKKKATYFKN